MTPATAPLTAAVAALEAALLEAETARDNARKAWLQAGMDNLERNDYLHRLYVTSDGVLAGMRWAVDIVTGGSHATS